MKRVKAGCRCCPLQAKQPDWREALKHGAEEGGEEAATAAAES